MRGVDDKGAVWAYHVVQLPFVCIESLVEPEEIGKTSVNEGQMYASLGFRKLPTRRIGYGSVICAFDSAALEIRLEMSTSVQYW